MVLEDRLKGMSDFALLGRAVVLIVYIYLSEYLANIVSLRCVILLDTREARC